MTTPFTPDQKTGLIDWHEARTLYLPEGANLIDAAAVAAWAAVTVGSTTYGKTLAQATSGLQPVFRINGANGVPEVYFGGTQWLATPAFTTPVSQPYTVYLVFRSALIGNQHVIDGIASDASDRMDHFLTNGNLQLYAGGAAYRTLWPQSQPFTAQTPSKAHTCFATVVNGASTVSYRNGVVGTTVAATPGTQGPTGLTIGAFEGGAGGTGFSGAVAAVLIYEGAHTQTDVNQLMGYFDTWIFRETTPQVVCDGDSLSFAHGLPNPLTQSYPAQLQALLGNGWDVYDTGVSGRPIGAQSNSVGMVGFAVDAVDPLYRPGRSANVSIVWGGVNDMLGIGYTTSNATVEASIQAYCAARRAIGWKVCVVTLPPSNFSGTSGSYEANRLLLNTWLRANYTTFADGLIDIGGSTPWGQAVDTGADTIDGLHLIAGGYTALAALAQPVVSAFVPTPTYPTAAQVLTGVTFGPTDNLTGNVTLPSAAQVVNPTTFGAGSATTGTVTLPAANVVQGGTAFGPGSATIGTAPAPADVAAAVWADPNRTLTS
jgi:lysophospholipase L1-like esterase